MFKYEYGRSALETGLELEASIGANPYEMAFNGSSDAHTGLASTGEENYFGKMASAEPSPSRFDGDVIQAADPTLRIVKAQESASGLTGVWALREHKGRDFRRADAQGNLCHHWHAHPGATVCRLGLRPG